MPCLPFSLPPAIVDDLFRKAGADRWALPREDFAAAVGIGAERAFAGTTPSRRDVDRYLAGLHVEDLALACACALGLEAAWDHFVLEHRPVLYRAADALDPGGSARELADSLYGDLYGMNSAGDERQSLFRYFHGRSSLATWLRAVLAQRHVDALRARRRLDPLPDDERGSAGTAPPTGDPDRPRLTRLVVDALQVVIGQLAVRDRLRLRSYYVAQLTLAQIGRLTAEHEATVSRHLTRTRRSLREGIERHLRERVHLSEAEIGRAVELALEDPGALDLQQLIGSPSDPAVERKELSRDRSR